MVYAYLGLHVCSGTHSIGATNLVPKELFLATAYVHESSPGGIPQRNPPRIHAVQVHHAKRSALAHLPGRSSVEKFVIHAIDMIGSLNR